LTDYELFFMRKSCFFATILLLALPQAARADYFATVLAPASFDPAAADILRLDENTGQPVPGFDFELTGGGLLVAPSSITVGPDQFLYVSDFGTGGIFRIDPITGAGQQIGLLPPLSLDPFFPTAAASLRFGPNFTLFVASPNTDKVFELDIASNTVLNEIDLPLTAFPVSMNFDNDGSLLVSGLQTGVIYRVEGDEVTDFITPDNPTPSNPSGPLAILPTADGRYWVGNVFRNSLRLYDDNGVPLTPDISIPPALPDEIPSGATALTNSPSEFWLDDQGNLLISTLGIVEGQGALLRYERPAGDFNGDMRVDAADYAVWRSGFGQSPGAGHYDGNGDGTFDAADYVVWRDSLGTEAEFVEILTGAGQSYSSILQFTPSTPSLAAGAAVPEPTSLAAAIVGGFVGLGVFVLRR
jgi:streptogramin lyase